MVLFMMKRGRVRGIAAILCLLIASGALAAAMPSFWVRDTLVDPVRFQAIVGALPEDPAVRDAVARAITDEAFAALHIEDTLHSALAERVPALAFVSGSLVDGMKDFVRDQVDKVLASQQFDDLWNAAVARLHSRFLEVLRGESEVMSIENGEVIIDVTPIINNVLDRIDGFASDLLGKTIDIPPVTGTMLPDDIRVQLESALGVDLPEDFGHIVVYQSDALGALQESVAKAQRWMVIIEVLFAVGVIGGMAVSTRRRRTVMQMSSVFAVVVIVERRIAIASVAKLTEQSQPQNRAAVTSIADGILSSFLASTVIMLALFAVIFLITLFVGPYRWAVALRSSIARFFQGTMHLKGALHGSRGFVARHRDALRIAAAVLGILVVLFTSLSIGWLIVVVGLIAAFEIAVTAVPADSSADWL